MMTFRINTWQDDNFKLWLDETVSDPIVVETVEEVVVDEIAQPVQDRGAPINNRKGCSLFDGTSWGTV